MPHRCCAIVICLLVTQPVRTARATDYQLYYLGGQSNMDGYGQAKDLDSRTAKPVDGVMIFHGNMAEDGGPVDGRGLWSPLQVGHGVGFSSDGRRNTYSDRFGVELTFARKLKELDPAAKIAIIKYSRGGTSIEAGTPEAARFGCWEPDFNQPGNRFGNVNQYDHFLATLNGALAARDIDGDGTEDQLIPTGIVWMQGESDAGDEAVARKYQANLKRLMDLIRAALRRDDLPVVIGRISDSGNDKYENEAANGKVWNFGDVVRQAQADFVSADAAAALVTSTDNYAYCDPWHYDSAGYIDLGARFAEAVHGLSKAPR